MQFDMPKILKEDTLFGVRIIFFGKGKGLGFKQKVLVSGSACYFSTLIYFSILVLCFHHSFVCILFAK